MASIYDDYVRSRPQYGRPIPEPVKRKQLSPDPNPGRWRICMAFRSAGGHVWYGEWTGPASPTVSIHYGHCRTRQEHKTAIIREMRRNGHSYLGEMPDTL